MPSNILLHHVWPPEVMVPSERMQSCCSFGIEARGSHSMRVLQHDDHSAGWYSRVARILRSLVRYTVLTLAPKILFFLSIAILASRGACQEMEEKFDYWPTKLGIRGTVVVMREPSMLGSVFERLNALDPKSAIILVNGSDLSAISERFPDLEKQRVVDINTDWNLGESNRSLIWIDDRLPSTIPAETREKFVDVASQFLETGGAVFLCGQHAELAGHSYRSEHSDAPMMLHRGLNLLPDCLLQLEFAGTDRATDTLLTALSELPKCVGVGVESETVLLLQNRQMRVLGSGQGTFLLSSGTYTSPRIHRIRDMRPRVREFDKVYIDLTQWRREAIDRTLPPFPPEQTIEPKVAGGSLLIVGGGGMPPNLMRRFVELAGGVDNAKLVYVPCEERENLREEQSTVELWKRMGVKNATFIHTKDRIRADEDEAFLEPLKDATGIWFGGGRQWNLADSYYGTKAHRLMKKCVERGGVIGGSSAGASIQANYLARATPIENYNIMAPGYERGGLGFISGVAIDQHFSQRNRFPDLVQLVKTYPQILGIGIDEATAIEVSGSIARVTGRGNVYFVDGAKTQADGSPSFSKLNEGEQYDLIIREPIAP